MISGAPALKARWSRPGRRRDQRCSPKVFVIVPGLGLLGLGLSGPGQLGAVLAMTGGVVAMAGLVLLVQNATDRFDMSMSDEETGRQRRSIGPPPTTWLARATSPLHAKCVQGAAELLVRSPDPSSLAAKYVSAPDDPAPRWCWSICQEGILRRGTLAALRPAL